MNDPAISAAALQTLLERPAAEILRILVGLAADKNDADLLRYLTIADRHVLAQTIRFRLERKSK
ncbi:MAG: hypothetical protein ING69_10510 [Rhodocyclaceae bacterium]|nr:hypothetical protein [Rhodocyclaceae bacterium]